MLTNTFLLKCFVRNQLEKVKLEHCKVLPPWLSWFATLISRFSDGNVATLLKKTPG